LKFEVPDSFLELLMKCGEHYSPSPSTLIDVLRWASENREAAEKIAEKARGLNKTGRRTFEEYMFWLSYRPDEALERAIKLQEENRERRSLLSKIIAHARKGGYRLKMPNDCECEIRHDGNHYVFKFTPGGVEVQVYHNGRCLAETVKSLKETGEFSYGVYGISGIVLDEKMYLRVDEAGKNILEAIKENVNPYVRMVVKDD